MAKFMETDYCSFFETDAGQRVLADMLLEGGFFKLNQTLEEQAVQNFLKTVLCKIGCFDVNVSHEFVEKLITIRSQERKQ